MINLGQQSSHLGRTLREVVDPVRPAGRPERPLAAAGHVGVAPYRPLTARSRKQSHRPGQKQNGPTAGMIDWSLE